jgi:aminomethyltransferase
MAPFARRISLSAEIKKTPLHGIHVEEGGRMVPFAGWEMPVQYSGVLDEHTAVRTRAGMFDVSHMGEVEVRGPGALDYLQHVTSNDVSRLTPGRVQYSALTTPKGTFVDDLLVYRMFEGDYLLVINAANTPKDLAWLRTHAQGFDVRVEDVSDRYFQIAVQGPRAQEILQPLTPAVLPGIKYYAFERSKVAGVPALVSRTGYTGEDGFEIYGPWSEAEAIWRALREAGKPAGMIPAGLGARDTLRLEAKMALYGNDIDDTTTVYEADLGWIVKLEKGEFLGRAPLALQKAEGTARKLVGFETEGRAVARHGHPVLVEGVPSGSVTSGSFSPTLKKNIGLAYLPPGAAEPGTRFEVEIRGRRERAVVVPTPFYKRSR